MLLELCLALLPQEYGNLYDMPQTVVVSPTTANDEGLIDPGDALPGWLKNRNDIGASPLPFPAPGAQDPDFRILPWSNGQQIEIDALSTNHVFIPVDKGRLQAPSTADGWIAVLLSVDPSTTGEAGSYLNQQPASDRAGIHFQYVVDGSTGLPPEYIDQLLTANDVSDISLVTQPNTQPDTVALESYIPMLINDPEPWGGTKLIFSVTNGSAAAATNQWTNIGPVDGNDVLFTEWTGSEWTEPTVWLDGHSAFGVPPTGEISGLAWDESVGAIVFASDHPTDPLMVAEPKGQGWRVDPLLTPTGYRVSIKIKFLSTDKCDAVCIIDPRSDRVRKMIGSHRAPGGSPLLSSGLYRADLGADRYYVPLRSQVSGTAALWIAHASPALFSSPSPIVPPTIIDVKPVGAGDKIRFIFPAIPGTGVGALDGKVGVDDTVSLFETPWMRVQY